MSATISLMDAIVICSDGKDPVTYTISEKTGKKSARFSVGIKEYDASYPNNFRFNNYSLFVSDDMLEVVESMKLKKGSCLHIEADIDFSKECLNDYTYKGTYKKGDPEYGISRSLRGLFLKVYRIKYAGTYNGAKKERDESPTGAFESVATQEEKTSNLEKTDETGDALQTTEAVEVTKASVPETTEELVQEPVREIDISQDDIFKDLTRTKRKFW